VQKEIEQFKTQITRHSLEAERLKAQNERLKKMIQTLEETESQQKEVRFILVII
jgi:hypothetical protein